MAFMCFALLGHSSKFLLNIMHAPSSIRTGRITHAWVNIDSHGKPPWAEAKTGLFAISCALAVGLDSIIFEGDALQVINSLQNSASYPHWSISNIINDINVFALSFSCISFSHDS
jgi:hypothetical protein